ncbi:MAG: 4Fe-4S dicluster domain-containing protein [Burkholderiales bacterium]
MIESHGRAPLAPVPNERDTPPGSVLYRSRGAVLVAGDDPSILPCARELARTLKVVVFAPGAEPGDLRANPLVVGGRVIALEGRLGAFRAKVRAKEGELDIGGFSPNGDRCFDLVLDLQATPLLHRAVLPHGYFAPSTGELAGALDAIRAMVGTFAKPRFFDYAEELCAHGARGYAGCTRCLAVCGADAIRSDGDRIAVDPHLCQGCAACTLACPTGALSFRNPARHDLLDQLDRKLANVRDLGGTAVVVAHAPAAAAELDPLFAASGCVALEVEPLAAFGEELWFGALARGARSVVLVAEPDAPVETRKLLAERVALARAVLAASGLAADTLRLVEPSALASALTNLPAARANGWTADLHAPGKRAMLTDALARIEPQAGFVPAALAPGAPLGAIAVERAACTLCSACANLCPTGALRFGEQPVLRLAFVEQDCVQCGICEAACPEHAIALIPRIAPAGERRSERLLHEDERACCERCGTPFISARLLSASIAKVASRMPMTAAAEKRMRLCLDCRRRATLFEGAAEARDSYPNLPVM